jgi:hypothetical protein
MISGTTSEEIAASIENTRKLQQAVTQRAAANLGPSVPPTNPEALLNFGELTPDQIQGMSMEDWAKYRKTVLPTARGL